MKNNFLSKAYGGVMDARHKLYGLGLPRQWKVITSTLLLLFTFAIGNVWGAATVETYNSTGAASNGEIAKTGSTLPGNYDAGTASKPQGHSESGGLKLRTQNTKVTVSDVEYGYAVITANSGYTLKSFQLDATSNGSNTITLYGVYVDVDASSASNLATALATATNQLSSNVIFPNKNTNYVSTPNLSINASSNIVLLFSGSGDNQLRAVIKVGYELAGADPDPTITFSDGEYATDGAALDLSTLFTSNSSGAVTYTVKTDGGTGAAIDGTSFTATTEGTAVVTASQAAVPGSYAEKSVDASIVVSEPYSVQVPATAITLPNFPAEGWAGKITPAYYNNGTDDWYVLNPYELYQSRTNLTWTDCSNPGSSDLPEYAASAPFPASTTWSYGGGESKLKMATVNSKAGGLKGPYVYRVKNCTSVALYGSSGSNNKRTVYLKAFEVTAGVAATTPAKTVSFESSAATVVSMTGLSASKEYVIEISQKNVGSGGSSEGNSSVYAIAFLSPSCTKPAAPTALSCTDHTVNSLTFGWTKETNATSYVAKLYSDSECETEVDSKNLGDVATVTFTGLSNSTTYYCKVQSKGNGTTYCEDGNVTAATSGATDAPSCGTVTAPTQLLVTATTAEGASFTIVDDEDAFNYELYIIDSNTAPTGSSTATHTSTAKTKDVTGLTSGTTYYAWVRSVCDADHKSAWTASSSFKVRTNPTASFANATYIIGQGNLDMSAKFSSNSEGAVVYELKEATANAEVTSAGVFSATVAGEYVVVANQAGNSDYMPISKEATVTVLDNEISDIYIWSKATKYGGEGKCISASDANKDANANAASTTLNYSTLAMDGMTSMGRPGGDAVITLTFSVKGDYSSLFGIKSICTMGKLEEPAGGQISWDNGTTWTALDAYGAGDGEVKTFNAPTGVFPASFKIKFVSASTSVGGLYWRNALITLEAKKTVTGVTEALVGAEINGVAISSAELTTLLANKTLAIATAYAAAPTVTFKKQVTTSYAGGWPADVENVDVEVTASDITTAWSASATINAQGYTITIAKPTEPSLETAATGFTLTSAKIATAQESFTFSGMNLTSGNVTIALESSVAGMTVTPAEVTPTAGVITDQEVTITYKSLENVAEANVNLIVSYSETVKLVIPLTYSSTVGYEDLTSISAATTWNWNGAADVAVGTVINKDQMIILANADATWDEGFNARAIAGKLEYMYRDSKYSQGYEWKFNTTIPGKVFVTYSNTGGNDPRTTNINGTKGTNSSSTNKEADIVTDKAFVSAGDVLIQGVQVSDDEAKYLRVYKIEFKPIFSVTYNAGEGSVKGGETLPTQADEAAGETIVLAASTALEKDGYDFTGWLCNIDGVTYAAGADYTMTAAATTFTAQWTLHVDPVDPTLTYDDGAYTVGGAALDLSTLITAQTSTGAITYSVKTDGGTGAAIDGNNFTATVAGTATITASQAAVLGYNAITVDFNVVVTEATEIDGIKLVEAGALTGNFVSARTLSNGDNTIEGIAYTKYLTMSSTMTSFGNEVAPSATKGIYYYPSHKNIRFYFYVNNNQSSAKKIYIYTVDEDAESTSDATSANISVDAGRHLVYADVELTKHAAVVFGVENTGTQICQIVAVESGDELLQGGEAGYSIDYNLCYISPKANTVAVYDGIEYKLYADAKLVSASNVQLQTLGTHYIKFHLDAPMTVNVYADNKKYYVGSECSTDAAAMTYEATGDGEFSLAAGDWYINGSGVLVKINKLSFSAPKCEQPTIDAQPVTNVTFGAGNLTASVTAHVNDGGTLSYQWYNASDDSEVTGADEATLTTTTEGTYYVIVTNTLTDHQDNSIKSDEATLGYRTLNDATLSALSYGDPETAIALEADKYDYRVILNEGTTEVPALHATATMNPYPTVTITNAASFTDYNAQSTVHVLAEDGLTELTYTVNFIVKHIYTALEDVTGSTTWNWSGSVDQTIDDVPNKGVIIANYIEGDNFERIEGKAGEYARRNQNGGVYQGTYLHFNTTVPGRVKFYFRAPSGGENCTITVKNGGRTVVAGTRTNSFGWSEEVFVNGDVVIEMVNDKEGGGTTRVQQVVFTTATPDYTRGVTEGRYGTICLPNGGVMVGAELYEVAYKDLSQNKIFFDQIVNGEMIAGRPYVFLPKEGTAQLAVYYTDDAAAAAGNYHGLYGFIGESSTDEFTIPQNDGNYIIQNNQYREVQDGVAKIVSNRAYLKMSEIPGTAYTPLPGRKRMSIGAAAPAVATGVEDVQGDNVQCTKVLINGQLFILRGEKMYDAKGQLVK